MTFFKNYNEPYRSAGDPNWERDQRLLQSCREEQAIRAHHNYVERIREMRARGAVDQVQELVAHYMDHCTRTELRDSQVLKLAKSIRARDDGGILDVSALRALVQSFEPDPLLKTEATNMLEANW